MGECWVNHTVSADGMSETLPVLILDNGAYEIKAGYSAVDNEPR